MANGAIQIIDNSNEVLEAFNKQVRSGLAAIGLTAEKHAKSECPVDTGRLRNSITNAVQEDGVYIGTNVAYAPYVEYRDVDHQTGKAHFLRDAATTHNDEYRKLMELALKT